MARLLDVIQLDTVGYDEALALQRRIVEEYARSRRDAGTLILLEHPPVLTIGRSGSAVNIIASQRELEKAGVRVIETNRGGDVTYHGPGQIVGYPILPLEYHGKDVHGYLQALESVLIATLREYGIAAERRAGLTGVWTPAGKIASIGVAISHWISYHGFALNVAPNLEHFKLIHPCGLRGISMTSMEKELGRAPFDLAQGRPPRREVEERLIARFCEEFGFTGRAAVGGASPAPQSVGAAAGGADRSDPGAAKKMAARRAGRPAFPPWIKKRIPTVGEAERVRELLVRLRLATVCQSARCPNLCECFARGTATFMILGKNCTRNCGFCAVGRGAPEPPDPTEPERVAEAAAELELRHVVVTSVTRDDLPDGGAEQFRRTILAIAERPGGAGDGTRCRIEVLTPDFQGDGAAIECVASAGPDVYNHNVETAPRLYPEVRPQADYRRSLALLRQVKERFPAIRTKSGMMVGLGETTEEVEAVLRDLREAGCELATIGQYLQPTPERLPVREFVTPEQFAKYEALGRRLGFAEVAAGPFVRSSYNAGIMYDEAAARR